MTKEKRWLSTLLNQRFSVRGLSGFSDERRDFEFAVLFGSGTPVSAGQNFSLTALDVGYRLFLRSTTTVCRTWWQGIIASMSKNRPQTLRR